MKRQVAQCRRKLRLAMVSGNQQALEHLAAEDLSYGHSGGKLENKKAFVDQLVSGRSKFTHITLSEQTISVVGNAAIVRHNLSAATNDAGKAPGTIQLSILLVWVKQQGDWKLLARQAVKKN